MQRSGLMALDFFHHVDADYGAEGGLSVDDNEGEVTVPECQFSLQDEHYDLLQQHVNPVSSSDNYGIELYQETLQFISNTVYQNQTDYQQWIA